MSDTNTRNAGAAEPCPVDRAAIRDADGFCSAHGRDCADYAMSLRADDTAPEDTDAADTSSTGPEPAHTPDDPRYPEIEVDLLGQDASILSIVTRVSMQMRRKGLDKQIIDEFFEAVTSKKYDAGLHEVLCWVSVALPQNDDD
jgi:hypothetical protein